MEINGIVLSPDPRLRPECAADAEINSALRALVARMTVQMFETGGCGLAAPQVGETIQLAIVDTEYTCEIRRPDHVVVEAYNLEGECIRYEAAGDLFCVCLQHEIDHLHGKTMFERLLPQQRMQFCVCLQHEIDHLHGKTMFERLLPQQRMHAMRQYQDALARGAKPGETE